ncbi:anaphase-promoting complex subunit Swm1p [Monosporozyma unispora]|nr:hypothetical protein C6P44_003860 [Kazachstania unispora]
MYQYRDSNFQFQHLTHSYYALYNEWMDDDDLPPLDDSLNRNNENPVVNNPTTGGNNNIQDGGGSALGSDIDPLGADITTAMTSPNNNNDNVGTQYWDYFDDEENWEIFNKFNLHLESNGIILYNRVIGQDLSNGGSISNIENGTNLATQDEDNNTGDNIIEDTKDSELITGSLFDPRILTRIRNIVNGWNEMGEHLS